MTNWIIAIFTIVIAFFTYTQYQLSLYEKRFKCFIKIKNYINCAKRNPQKIVNDYEYNDNYEYLKTSMLEIEFLFDAKVIKGVDEFYNALYKYALEYAEVDKDSTEEDEKAKLKINNKATREFNEIKDKLLLIFKPYLDLSIKNTICQIIKSFCGGLKRMLGCS